MVKEMKNDFEEDRKKLKQVNNLYCNTNLENKLTKRISAILEFISLSVSLVLANLIPRIFDETFTLRLEELFHILNFLKSV